ncbi:MAG: SRPBCC domain-containing protein [Bacteroidetes bacterium]|nr:SRPBCC domain-containing protein [Bacteroidota bacterium]
MSKKFVAKQAVVINAPSHKVWDALANPEIARQYMFGTNAIPNWKKVGPIVSDQNSQSTAYRDKGVLLKMEPERFIKYCYYSPLSGLPDKPENYHTVTLELSDAEARTILLLSQDNNPSEQARIHTKNSWGMMLSNLKELLEAQSK